jgi:hypothetical protein
MHHSGRRGNVSKPLNPLPPVESEAADSNVVRYDDENEEYHRGEQPCVIRCSEHQTAPCQWRSRNEVTADHAAHVHLEAKYRVKQRSDAGAYSRVTT